MQRNSTSRGRAYSLREARARVIVKSWPALLQGGSFTHTEKLRATWGELSNAEKLYFLGERAFALREARARVIVMASSTTGWSFPSPTT